MIAFVRVHNLKARLLTFSIEKKTNDCVEFACGKIYIVDWIYASDLMDG